MSCNSSVDVKNFRIILIACNAELALLIDTDTCCDHCILESKRTPKTFIVDLDVIVVPFRIILTFWESCL